MNVIRGTAQRAAHRPTLSREVVVTRREQLTERMLRVTFGGDDLAAVVHGSAGSWVKLFVRRPGDDGEHGRAFTVRGYDPLRDEIEVDFFLHDGGTMPRWARGCRIGEPARVGGPRRGHPSSGTATSLALFGDETALPAVAAILAREHGDRPVRAFVETGDPRDRQDMDLPRGVQLTWLDRRAGDAPGARLVSAASRERFGASAGVWFAAEAGSAALFRRMLHDQDLAELHVKGYWRRGVGDYRD